MNLRELVDLMFLDDFEPAETVHPTNPEYIQLIENCKKLKRQFDEQLTEPQKTLLEDYLTELLIKASYEQREYFLEGIATGIRIVSEAFSMHNPF